MSLPVRPGPPRTSGVHEEQAHEARSPFPDRRPGDAADRPRSACRRDAASRTPASATCARRSSASPSSRASRRRRSRSTSPISARPSTAWWPPRPRCRANAGPICAATSPPPSRASGLRPMLKTADLDLDAGLDPASGARRPADPQWSFAVRPMGEPARNRPAGRRRQHHRAVSSPNSIGDPDPESWRTCPQRRKQTWNALVGLHPGRWAAAGCGADQRACADPKSLGSGFQRRFGRMSSGTSPGRPCRTPSPRGRGPGPSRR